ncbi:MAG: complex I subunit 5 family protein [Halothiobacillaceae bacterium]
MSPVWLAALPLLAAVFSFADRPRRRLWGVLGTLVTLAAALLMPASVGWHQPLGGWSAPLGIVLSMDRLSLVMILMTAVVGAAISVYASADRALSKGAFWPVWMMLWAGMNALYLSDDLFNLYVGLEIIGLSAVALVTLSGKAAALQGAMRYLLVSLMGSLGYLMGVAIVYGLQGTLDMALLATSLRADWATAIALALMTAGLMAKTALFPLHSWLPPAHGAAPAAVSALLSALVVKASFYLLLRLFGEVFANLPLERVGVLFLLAGAAAVFWGGLQALTTPRLKLLVAWSTVAQLGYLGLLLGLLAAHADNPAIWSAMVLFLLAHAAAKATMFLAAGNFQRGAGGEDGIAALGPVMDRDRMSLFAFGIAGASLAGLPITGGFLAKWLMLENAMALDAWSVAVVVLLGGLLAAAYTFRVLATGFSAREQDPAPGAILPVPALMRWATLALALLTVALGLGAGTGLAGIDPDAGTYD